MRSVIVAEFIKNHPPPVIINAVAIRLAKRCREVFDGLLREEEFRDAEEALYEVIKSGLEEIAFPPGAQGPPG